MRQLSMIREFWRELRGPVHPQDADVFARHRDHTFDLRFPPPAFIGDVDRAPIMVLMANGGFDPERTPLEFPDESAVRTYLDWLHDSENPPPHTLAQYYRARTIGPWLERGVAAIVNAVAYRSTSLSKEPKNRKVAELLPSVVIHRKWLRDELLPAAREGRRFVIVHRNGMWKVDRSQAGPGVLFSPNSIGADPARITLNQAAAWLQSRAISQSA
ncbi:hypothetical protein [Microvirga sp. CF3016]|uniref:hypothetical protein n=1 Tax=Microvirga sp. CF3016 TaxID=3110181 RepID=UPI002E771560|nr:hypothetical protein [Microvirga sp. CF3016]MEE1611133.1 hypothetical protein [Microvirga sp. CF3016]